MKHILIAFILCFMCLNAQAAPYRLMIFGDSLSAGYGLPATDSYGTRLQSALDKAGYDVTVINNSKSGETTTGGLNRITQVLSDKPDGVILELGINDALNGSDIETIQKNLQTLVTTFQSHNVAVMLVGMQVPTRDTIYRQKFIQMYKDIAAQNDLYFYPFFMKDVLKINLAQRTFDRTLLQADGAHPTAKGVLIMVENTLPTVIAFLKENGVQK